MAQNGSGTHASGWITFVPPWLGVLSGHKRFLNQGNDLGIQRTIFLGGQLLTSPMQGGQLTMSGITVRLSFWGSMSRRSRKHSHASENSFETLVAFCYKIVSV
jgi:hypothetical protein